MTSTNNKKPTYRNNFRRCKCFNLSPITQWIKVPLSLNLGITDTMLREVYGVIYKFSYVLIPRGSHDGTNKLRNWDMWGPFLMSLIFGIFINSMLFFQLQRFYTVYFTVLFCVFRWLCGYVQYKSTWRTDLLFSGRSHSWLLYVPTVCCCPRHAIHEANTVL